MFFNSSQKPHLEDFTHDISGIEMRVESNILLRPVNCVLPLTTQHIQEVVRCSTNMEYFIQNYLKIVHPDRGLISFDIDSRPYQKRFLNHISVNRFSCCKLPRQSGKTTMVAAYLIWYSLFNANKLIVIMAHKMSQAEEILYKVKMMYQHLPKWMQQGVTNWGMRSIGLENGTRFKIESTSKGSAAGLTINLLVLDEFALVPPHLAETFIMSAFPTISASKESKTIIISTPRGLNHFYRLFTEENEFVPFEIPWTEVPGRDEVFKEKTIETFGTEHWYQEYETRFLGSSNTLVNAITLQALTAVPPKEFQFGSKIRIFEDPIPGHKYVIGIDASQGVGADFHAFEVFDVTEYPLLHVLSGEVNDMKIAAFTQLVFDVATHYNRAIMVVETNNTGVEVVNRLVDELVYDNVWSYNSEITKKKKILPGININKSTKILACQRFKELLESQKIVVRDDKLIQQIRTFVSKGVNFGYAAESGYHDDKVMAAIFVAFFVASDDFKTFLELPDGYIKKVLKEDISKIIEHSIKFFSRVDDDPSFLNLPEKFEYKKYFFNVEMEEVYIDRNGNKQVKYSHSKNFKDEYEDEIDEGPYDKFSDSDNWLLSDL